MNRGKILIVDDELIGRQLLQAVLLPDGYEIFLAENGIIALEIIQEKKPDMVLLDIMMPEMDGYETAKKIRTISGIEDLPIIFISALDDRDSKRKGLETGATDFITKPFDRIDILAKVKSLINLKRSDSLLDVENKTETKKNEEL